MKLSKTWLISFFLLKSTFSKYKNLFAVNFGFLTSSIRTFIFNFASFFYSSRPIPPEPPVTTATLPLNVSFIALKYKI